MNSNLKVLYIQIREDEETATEEYLSFVKYSNLKEENFTTLNVFKTPKFEIEKVIENHHALFVGGSSDATVLDKKKYEFVEYCIQLMQHCEKHNIPVFASCFGFQVACCAFDGGEVILDVENIEFGPLKMTHSEHAKDDILFHDTPNEFIAIVGHKERASTLPKNAIVLGSTEKCPFHAFKIKDKHFYAFQYHPEMDKIDFQARLDRYCKKYPFDEKFDGIQSLKDQ
eukprot:gene437-6850_t